MIKEITNFVDELESNNPEIFAKNLELKEGLYIFLDVEEKNGECVAKNIDSEGKINPEDYKYFENNTELESFFDKCKYVQYYSKVFPAENNNKALDRKIFAYTASPYSIAFEKKKYLELDKDTIYKKLNDYFRFANKYNLKHKWQKNNNSIFSIYLLNNFFKIIENTVDFERLNNKHRIHIFHKTPTIQDYEITNNKYLKEKVFNKGLKDKSNINIDNKIWGPPDSLISLEDKKRFKQHKTGLQKYTFRTDSESALKLFKFFQLQNNKQLPNPVPIFIDKEELINHEMIELYGYKKQSFSNLIKDLIEEHKRYLHNYYLIYFQGFKKSRIADLDFVPMFKYYFEHPIKLEPVFNINNKNGELILKEFYVNNVFDFENLLNKYVFLQYLNNSDYGYGILNKNYFTPIIKPTKGYFIYNSTLNNLYKYRQAIYDYVYKSKREALTPNIFNDIMFETIKEDIISDNNTHSKEISIKQKLNIWFNLSNQFEQNKNQKSMASKIPELTDKCRKIAHEGEHLSDDPAEFAFAAGQIIYFLLTKSKASNKTHALLEPFLQKANVELLQDAISNTFNTYKHEINFSKGRFENLAKEVLAFKVENTSKHIKKLHKYLLAGYFAEQVIFESKK